MVIDTHSKNAQRTANAAAVVEPGRDAFQKDDVIDASPAAVTSKPDGAVAVDVAAPVAEVVAVESSSSEEKVVESATAAFDPGRQGNPVLAAVPPVAEATKAQDPAAPVVVEVEVPRNLEEKLAAEVAEGAAEAK